MASDPLKVLIVAVYHPDLVKGGSQQVAYELFQELSGRDHVQPVLLAAANGRDSILFRPDVRITGFDGRPNEYLYLTHDYDHWWQKNTDPALTEAYVAFLRATAPDVVHFHHFLNIGVDIISLTRRILPSCRIIFTFHEFLAICQADGQMVRRTDRSLCRKPSPIRCHQCFPERHPDEFAVRKLWFSQHLAQVDEFTCPTRFMIEHYVDWGIPREKISWVTNGQQSYAPSGARSAPARKPPNRFGYFGQLHDSKGVHVVFRAVNILRSEGFTDFRVEINGDNIHFASSAMQAEIQDFLTAEAALPPNERIVIENGAYDLDQLHRRMTTIDWSIVPSIWWEIFGLVISEAWMFGKPVICSNVGGMAERVRDNVDGLHFEMGNPRALADAIRRACTEKGLWERLHGALPEPPTRAHMADMFTGMYRRPALP